MNASAATFVAHVAGALPPSRFLSRRLAPRAGAPKRNRVATLRLNPEADGQQKLGDASPVPQPSAVPRPLRGADAASNGAAPVAGGQSPSEEHALQRRAGSPDAERFDPLGKAAGDSQPAQVLRKTISLSFGSKSFSIPARWLLYSVPFFWGSFAPAVRFLFAQEQHPEPAVFNSMRLLLSTLVYLPILATEFADFRNRGKSDADPNKSFAFLYAGAELGIYVFLANVAQVLGLQQTSASRAAFLVQLQTVFVPILAGLFGLDKISRKTWISSLVAVAGVALLSSDKGHGTVSSLTGDALEVLSALLFSAYIIRLSKYCNDVPANPLVATKIAVQAVLSVMWALSAELFTIFRHTPTDVSVTTDGSTAWTTGAVLATAAVVMWTGLMSSAASGWAQTKGQQGVPASEAVVIFATQPLWAGGLAALVLGESFGVKGVAGGALIVAATLLASKKDGENVHDGKKGA